MQRICVFCGSSPGSSPDYASAARGLGRELVSQGLELVYGGARVGLMGELAREVLAQGGRVTGVIPAAFVGKELAFTEASDLRIVGSMHERKALMADLSDAFIALPGGLGTFEEFFEVLTWAQLGMHRKPCGLLNVRGYYDGLATFLDYATAQQFIEPGYRAMVLMAERPAELLAQFRAYEPPQLDKAALNLKKGVPSHDSA